MDRSGAGDGGLRVCRRRRCPSLGVGIRSGGIGGVGTEVGIERRDPCLMDEVVDLMVCGIEVVVS